MIEQLIGVVLSLAGIAQGSLVAFVLCVLLALVALMWLAARIVEAISKALVTIGAELERWRTKSATRQARKTFINRRGQFLRALETDLAGIARAEAWNDQHFTDLDAEVEVEGGYYASAFHRLIRRKTFGLRRVPSLIGAIDNSTEKCLLLTGEPGSGKSVALRHLAMQVIERGKKSRDERHQVPLYINLRELDVGKDQRVTAEVIKAFVIENARRGDVDAHDYVTLNWNDFKEKGIWLFLFDSFDEIPAILHAAHSEHVVGEYSQAIRMFMDGVDACRGILASREFKSPRSIGWPKLKILPMGESTQEALIARSFLPEELKPVALKKISASRTATFQNPLFLTLLCRFVKERGAPPANEHELLYAHVESLSRRDADYVRKKWKLAPEEVIQAASRLARLFAVDSDLGLAPTRKSIATAALNSQADFGLDINELLDALTYLKIGRTDVPASSEAERRFAFAHRRYQECLFASYLADNLNSVPTQELITDARWREYVVALLQVGKAEAAAHVMSGIQTYLKANDPISKAKARSMFGEGISTISWDDGALRHVLSLFQEAMRYREGMEASAQASGVEKLAEYLWSKGDYYDRVQVLQHCSAGYSRRLAAQVERAIESGVERLEEAALHACRYVTQPSEALAAWMRKCVAQRIFTSDRRFESLRWEALASELPPAYRMEICVARAAKLYSSSRFLWRGLTASRLFELLFRPGRVLGEQSFASGRRGTGAGEQLAEVYLVLYTYALGFPLVGIATLVKGPMSYRSSGLIALFVVVSAVLLRDVFRILCIDFAVPITPRLLFNRMAKLVVEYKARILLFSFAALILALPAAVVYLFHVIFGFLPQLTLDLLVSASIVWWVLVVVVTMSFVERMVRRIREGAARLLEASRSLSNAISKASKGRQVFELSGIAADRGIAASEARDAVSLIFLVERAKDRSSDSNLPAWSTDDNHWPRKAVSRLIERIEASSSSA